MYQTGGGREKERESIGKGTRKEGGKRGVEKARTLGFGDQGFLASSKGSEKPVEGRIAQRGYASK